MNIPFIRKSNYARHGHLVGEIKKTIQGNLFHLRYVTHFRFKSANHLNTFFFVFDPKYNHPGLADRLKAIVYCYYIAKQSGYVFKIVQTKPFLLTDYLIENKVNWTSNENELEYSIIDTRFFIYTARRTGIDFKLPPNRQYHCYCYKGDDLFYQTGHPYGQCFPQLYNELFKPGPLLQKAINEIGLEPRKYISVHIRFVNALGVIENPKYPTLSEERQDILIKRCHATLNIIAHDSTLPVYVFSDSVRFLNTLSDLPVHTLENKNISHVSRTTDKESILKTFVDWYIISQSNKVYRLLSDELYQTNFSLYAALTEGVEVIDLNI
ncbi:MAG: hypothetical protein J6W38_09460 [Prevotella sp.]|nr:hypothetical protein [Prevotella sp.]